MEKGNKLSRGGAWNSDLLKRWPKDEKGEPEEPVLLCRCKSVDMSDQLLVNMLEAYAIPCLCTYPGDGSFGRVVLGMSGQGAEIYVPRRYYDDAVALCQEEKNEEL